MSAASMAQRHITLLIISTPPYPFSIEFEFTPIIKVNGFSSEELELHCKETYHMNIQIFYRL